VEETIKQPIVEWGVASRTHKGQSASADRHLVRIEPAYTLVAAVDGLGHGEEAASAASTAIKILENTAERSVIRLLNQCHERLLSTRGVVMSAAIFDTADDTLTWVGVGNVEGLLLRAHPDANPRSESLLLRNGVVGARMPFIHASIVPILPGDTLIFWTDGVRTDFSKAVSAEQPPQQMADRIMTQSHKGTDDALVVVVRYRGGAS
jgi:negative regulator of sigma-B (phosphoserine phosphatase)